MEKSSHHLSASSFERQRLTKTPSGSTDTALTIVFGAFSIIIGLLGVIVGYFTLRAMTFEDRAYTPLMYFLPIWPLSCLYLIN